MSYARRILLSAFFAAVVAGHAVDIVLQREDWPFSHYPMFSEPRAAHMTGVRLVGVGPDGEFPLTPSRHFPPLDGTRFQRALAMIRRDPEASTRQTTALETLARRYEVARAQRRHDDPPLRAIRSYDVTWTLESGARNRHTPDSRELRLQIDMPATHDEP